MYFYKEEAKILKYLKKKKKVNEKQVTEKFPDFDENYWFISTYIDKVDLSQKDFDDLMVEFNQKRFVDKTIPEDAEPPEYQPNTERIFYQLSREGHEYFYKKRHDAWLFWFPYIVTTLISIVAAAPTIYKIFKFISGLFIQGTP